MNSYLAANIDKQKLLLTVSSPKVIFIGGSNVAFGIDSTRISEKIGIPVINMGLQGSLGIRFQLNDIKSKINKGDILILAPEYENILGHLSGGETLSQLLVVYPQGITELSSWNEFWEVTQAFPSVHTEAIKNMVESSVKHDCFICENTEKIYYRAAFDMANGDVIINTDPHYPLYKYSLSLREYHIPNPYLKSNIDFLNEFEKYVQSRNARIYFLYPNTVDNIDEYTKGILNELNSTLNSELNFPVIGTPADAQFPNNLMFDTPYHLNSKGKAIRSEWVAQELCGVITDLNCK